MMDFLASINVHSRIMSIRHLTHYDILWLTQYSAPQTKRNDYGRVESGRQLIPGAKALTGASLSGCWKVVFSQAGQKHPDARRAKS
jgi:hypothetical protein